MESESERTLRVIEYWKKAYEEKNKTKNNNTNRFSIYDLDFTKGDDNELPYKPTAILIKAPPNQPEPRKRSIFNLSSLDFTT